MEQVLLKIRRIPRTFRSLQFKFARFEILHALPVALVRCAYGLTTKTKQHERRNHSYVTNVYLLFWVTARAALVLERFSPHALERVEVAA